MLLIILSWVYIVFTTINLGFGVDKLFKLQNKDFVVTSVLGLFATTILASFWAIFGRINIEFHYLLLTLNLLIFLKFKDDIFSIYTTFINELKIIFQNLKYYLFIITIFIIPNYQRGYAWEAEQVADFINDIKDAVDIDEHYTGQIIVASKQQEIIGKVSYDVYEVVDGQQQLKTM